MASIKDEFEDKKNKLSEEIEEKKEAVEEAITEKKEMIGQSIDSGLKKTKSFMKKLSIGLVLAAIVLGGLFILFSNFSYSDGTRAGKLIKISQKGHVFKTSEGQLKLGGIDLSNQEEGLSDTWSFSVTDDKIYQQLENLQGKNVKLRYKEIYRSMPWQGDTNYFITEVVLNE